MSRHLTDEEILDLLAQGVEPDPEARRHLAACAECHARVEAEEPLSRRVAALPDEAEPPRDLWPALGARIEAADRRSNRSVVPGRTRRWPAALRAAAAIAIFVLGALAGSAWERDPAAPDGVAAGDPLAAAAEVQRTGTAYVEALARFRATAAGSAPGAVEQAREVALAAVHGAAFELARLRPDDPTARGILALAGDRRLAGEGR